ncbi:fumarylacetoacetate hydrolase family protein [Pseudooceanicola onchidii]|uniref:fumarylacetoacetate hydrolase family protein n=1 Tax=Pseudooceanicola onchidii TaxID=2562279 RepID=UPI0010AA0907|nr:fumarylacetoacetate hydrolase family protein [Pseudooceanicola onchidii]
MRFFAFTRDGVAGLAIQTGAGYAGLLEEDASFPGSLDDILRAGTLDQAAKVLAAGDVIDPASITPALPFTRAGKVLCVGLNYADHASETGHEAPPYPTVFVRFNDNLVPHEGDLVCPTASDQFDYEGEVVAVIGKRGRHISRDAALDHVAGYTLFNDGSIRDFQMATPQWTLGKNFDATGALGPDFVTADALPAGAKGLRITTRLNGEVVQDANTDALIYDVATLIEKLSAVMTLEVGDLIVTGTPAGVGMARKPQLWMKPGDVCEVEVDQIGLLRNRVVAE